MCLSCGKLIVQNARLAKTLEKLINWHNTKHFIKIELAELKDYNRATELLKERDTHYVP